MSLICLGLEGTAHTIGVGIIDEGGNILTNKFKMYRPEKGGIHPREAANHHAQYIVPLIQEAISDAGIMYKDIDLIAFSQGPGLGPCLRTVATTARALALTLKIPIIGVNHCVAHLEIGRISGAKDPILLYVSGGNTQVIAFVKGKYRVFGETLDIGIGNMLDKFGRIVGLQFPAGAAIEEHAKQSSAEFIELPYSVKGMDMSFSGILTASERLFNKGISVASLCYSIQEVSFAMLTEVTERAMAHTEKEEVLLGGGVACNKRLQGMVSNMAQERGAKFFVPEKGLCIDNGVMIGWLGLLMHKSGVRMQIKDTVVKQRFRTDEEVVIWR
ncbi:bifunctional N(6)-L-threonylcarbamoyladenine synthase/serine/threonine protein kinase [[Eubacterium] cellulosolvens]